MIQTAVGIGMVVIAGANLFWTSVLATKTAKMQNLETELKLATATIIDSKFGIVLHRLTDCESRLTSGHGHFNKMDETIKGLSLADKELKLEVLQAIRQLEGVVATKGDLDRMRREMGKN